MCWGLKLALIFPRIIAIFLNIYKYDYHTHVDIMLINLTLLLCKIGNFLDQFESLIPTQTFKYLITSSLIIKTTSRLNSYSINNQLSDNILLL